MSAESPHSSSPLGGDFVPSDPTQGSRTPEEAANSFYMPPEAIEAMAPVVEAEGFSALSQEEKTYLYRNDRFNYLAGRALMPALEEYMDAEGSKYTRERFNQEFSGQLSPRGLLLDLKGEETNTRPDMLANFRVSEDKQDEALQQAANEFIAEKRIEAEMNGWTAADTTAEPEPATTEESAASVSTEPEQTIKPENADQRGNRRRSGSRRRSTSAAKKERERAAEERRRNAEKNAAEEALSKEVALQLKADPKLLEGILEKNDDGLHLRPNKERASGTELAKAEELAVLIEHRDKILAGNPAAENSANEGAFVEQPTTRHRRRATRGVHKVPTAEPPQVTPYSANNAPGYTITTGTGPAFIADGGVRRATGGQALPIQSEGIPSTTPGEIPTQAYSIPVDPAVAASPATAPHRQRGATDPGVSPQPAVDAAGSHAAAPAGAAGTEKAAAADPDNGNAQSGSTEPNTAVFSLRDRAGIGIFAAKERFLGYFSDAENGKRRKVVAAAAGLLALAGTGFLMYNGMYGGGSGGAREQAADALSSGKGGAGVDAAPPAPADVPPALADVPPAPAEVPPALVEVPEYARQSLERSGDTIWRDAADILRQQGIEDPSDGQIAEAKNRILAHIGKTEAEAASLPVGFQYEVPDLSDMFGPADAPAPDTPLQTQATHTELAAADTTHVHVASPTDTIAHSAVMSPPEVIDQYERLSQENRSGLSAYAGSLAMAKLTFDPVIEQVQQYYADEADHRTKKKAKKKKTAA